VCHAATGLLQEGLRWVSGGKEFRVDEVACIATGDQSCIFHVYKEPIG
jgi:predicted hydrocarbon binding protein